MANQRALAENILHFVEETRIALRRLVFDFHRLAELLEQPPLVARHFRRNHHADTDVEIALAAVRIRQALALLRKICPDCVPSGISSSSSPFSVGTLILAPSAACGKLTGIVQTRSAPRRSKNAMLFHFEKNIEIAGRPPLVPGSPWPVMRSRVPESTPAGTPTSRSRSRSMRPCAAAGSARVANYLPRALAGRACSRDGEKSLLVGHLPAAAAGAACGHARARLRARALAGLANLVARQRILVVTPAAASSKLSDMS